MRIFTGTVLLSLVYSLSFSQATHVITDPLARYKQAQEYMLQDNYALAYPLLKELQDKYPANTASDHAYLNDDISFYYILCELKLQLETGEANAEKYINTVDNNARVQLLAYNLAHYYFLYDNYRKTIEYYDIAGFENLSNDQIADAKFEKGYAYFNLKQFSAARPLFDEVHQLPNHKYFIPANYYFGFIAYKDRQFEDALKAFKLVETRPEYQGVVPYYIAEIYYLQGKKEEALNYGQSVLKRGSALYYNDQLKLLTGQLYFEKQQFAKALPLLEEYVKASPKVSKEVLYELSYAYYKENQLDKAMDGFKQLSNEKDSMGQNSMYILGDLYLRTNQKENARNAFQYSAYNSSNKKQQQISRFNYAKLSYELGYQNIALTEMKNYLRDYPNAENDNEAKEILVNLLANSNNFSEALALYESFDKPTPAMKAVYPRILFGRAMEYLNEAQLDRADGLLWKTLSANPSPSVAAFAQFWRGEIAYRQQRYDDAIRYLSLYLQASPPSRGEANPVNAKYDLGYSWFQKENYVQAQKYFIQVAPTITTVSPAIEQDAYLRAADCYYMQKEYGKATAMYDQVINNALPQSDYALLQKGMIAGIKSSAEKIKILNSITRQYPKSGLTQDINMEIAQTYIADQKFSDAIPFLNKITNASDATGLKPLAYLKTGLAYYNSNDNKNALQAYKSLIQKYPQSSEASEATSIIRDIYVEEGKPEEYVALMRENGVNVSVSEADSLSFAAAMIKYNNGDCTASILSLGNYISKFPDGAYATEANFHLGECFQKNKQWNEAVSAYAKVNQKGVGRFFEKATLEAARISYFELKNYEAAKTYFSAVITNAANAENTLEALRGLVRTYYQLKDYSTANESAKELLSRKGISTDDKAIASLVLGKSQQLGNDCNGAISSFKSVAAVNKSSWGAEARYEVAHCYFDMGNLSMAEKSAMKVIKETGSDYWITKAYILLGDIFMQQKDYFNAKATYQSVAANSGIPELKSEANQKLERAIAEEKQNSKIAD